MALSQNITIIDYCYDRKDELKRFHDYLKYSIESNFNDNTLRFPKKRTGSFKRRTPSRKKRFQYQIRNTNLNIKNPSNNRKLKRRQLPSLYKSYQPIIRNENETAHLETHLWHSKRAKMITLWNYRIPLHSTERGGDATLMNFVA